MGLFDASGNDFQFADFSTNINSGAVEGLGSKSEMFGQGFSQDNPADFGLGGSAPQMPDLPAELEFYRTNVEQVDT